MARSATRGWLETTRVDMWWFSQPGTSSTFMVCLVSGSSSRGSSTGVVPSRKNVTATSAFSSPGFSSST